MFRQKKWRHKKNEEAIAGYLFVGPAFLAVIVLIIGPMVATAVLSFTQYDLVHTPRFIGLQNYVRLLKDAATRKAFKNTVVFSIASLIGNGGGGLLLALIVNRKINPKLQYIYRLAFFFPVLISVSYTSTIWYNLYSTGTGVFNYFLSKWGFEPIGWLTSSRYAMMSIIIADIWKNVGFYMVIFLAGLQSIPSMYYEVAHLDGAGFLQRLRYVTLPLLSPTIFFVVVYISINALQVFDAIYIMTKGGPNSATKSIVISIYQMAFEQFKLGRSAAMAMLLFVLIGLLTAIQFRVNHTMADE